LFCAAPWVGDGIVRFRTRFLPLRTALEAS
jgi:hypothetical protein